MIVRVETIMLNAWEKYGNADCTCCANLSEKCDKGCEGFMPVDSTEPILPLMREGADAYDLCPVCGELTYNTGRRTVDNRIILACGDAINENADWEG